MKSDTTFVKLHKQALRSIETFLVVGVLSLAEIEKRWVLPHVSKIVGLALGLVAAFVFLGPILSYAYRFFLGPGSKLDAELQRIIEVRETDARG